RLRIQVQTKKKPELETAPAAIDAVRTGSLKHMQSCGYARPLEIIGDISRATVIAASGNRLFDVDLSGIESRGIALIANEFTKLDQWKKFDQTGREEDEPYYIFGTTGLNLDKGIARKYGKTGDLAFGYQGGTGAWRKMAPHGDTTRIPKSLGTSTSEHRKVLGCRFTSSDERHREQRPRALHRRAHCIPARRAIPPS